jgi:DNA-binding response OmpR family regulator
MRAALESGADDFMVKPINRLDLRARVSACLGTRHRGGRPHGRRPHPQAQSPLEPFGYDHYLQTVRGSGYRFPLEAQGSSAQAL